MVLPFALRESHPDDDPRKALAIADRAEAAGDPRLTATALDRAHGVAPHDAAIAARRRRILDGLAVVEHGLVFRYVPTGMFLMGSEDGDPDERPVRPTLVDNFWMSETTISWGAFCRLLGWEAPPKRLGDSSQSRFFPDLWGESTSFVLEEARLVRLQYCEDATNGARNWRSHDPAELTAAWVGRKGSSSGLDIFGAPDRPPDAPWRYEDKPMVAVSYEEAEALAATLSTDRIRYALPSEAQWEKAARGGLIGCRYAWGNDPPTVERCDFGRFEPFVIKPARTFPPNGYGLYAMCGSVWEWTSDYYDAGGPGSLRVKSTQRVLRGGSWTDPAEVVTVSFRMARHGALSGPTAGAHIAPNIGFRLCRFER